MIYSQAANLDVPSRQLGYARPAAGLWPYVIDGVSITAGSVLAQFDNVLGGTLWNNSRTVTVEGFMSVDAATAHTLMDYLTSEIGSNVGTGNVVDFPISDGRTLRMTRPILVGMTVSCVSVGGAMYLRTSHSLATRGADVIGSATLDDEKPARDAAVVAMGETAAIPITILFRTPDGETAVLGSDASQAESSSPSSPFLITQVSTRLSQVDMSNSVVYMPWCLEEWAINPSTGRVDPARGVCAGVPLTMSQDAMFMLGAAPNWSSYGVSVPPGGSNDYMGVKDGSTWWQHASTDSAFKATISTSVSGFFIDTQASRSLVNMIQPLAAGAAQLDFYDPYTGVTTFSTTQAKLSGHSVSQDISTFGGKPAIASTITFEYPYADIE